MENNQPRELTDQEIDERISKFKKREEFLRLQALMAQHRATIQRAGYEELAYAMKLYELQNPPRNDEESKPNPDKN